MAKKQYTAPVVRMVRLDIKTAVLAVCNSSPTTDLAKVVPASCIITKCSSTNP